MNSAMPSEADVVVVGSGAAGLAAALTAAEGGAKVVVFEKQRSAGGTSNFFEGMFAVESDMQREQYIEYSRDQAFKNIMEYSHWRANPRLVRAIVNESGPTIAWLRRQGVEFSGVTINMPNSPRTYHIVKGAGAAVVKTLVTKAKEKGVDLRLGAPVKRIIKEGGRVSGVMVEAEEGDIRVNAKAVVIASGGYANNREWIKKYTGFDLGTNLLPVGNVDKFGDGIRMAWEAGAAEEGIGVLELYRAGPITTELGGQVEWPTVQPDLWVNPRGERFCDESIAFYDTAVGNANARYKEGYTYSLFDDSIKRHYMEKGIDKSVNVLTPPGSKPLNFDRELEILFERGNTDVTVADSVEGLAGKLGMDAAVLKATVEEYNRFCGERHDALFAKDSRYLRPLRGPKFYAVKAHTVFLGTMGGIRINQSAEVVDKKENVIPGLYAAGFDAGGMYGDSYHVSVGSGSSVGFAFNSGRIAGKSALKGSGYNV
ncbi:MAG TPA: FAD-dependent oxidoreductase [Acidobacteriota bacterium]|nr:FAD-dependent oxidoreductase [Acidobacteriota bacterium]